MDAPSTAEAGGAQNQSFWQTWKKRVLLWALILGPFLLVCWILVIYDAVLLSRGGKSSRNVLYLHGIIPRTTKGILGILAAPFLHIGFEHVEADSLGVLILGTLLMLSSLKTFFGVTIFVWIVGGFGTWCVGRSHFSIVGCGILCFGWWGYLMVTPFFERPISAKAIVIAVVAGLLYGGIIFGLFRSDPSVSWEAGVCSLLAGVICSVGYWYLYRKFLAKHVEKVAPKLSAKLPTSPQVPSFKRFTGESFPKSTGEKDSAIVSQENFPTSTPQTKSHLLAPQNSNPFGAQDPYGNQSPTVLNHSSEPEWLFGPKTTPTQTPAQSTASSSNPSWLNPQQQEMSSFPPPSSSAYSSPTPAYSPPTSTNPFASSPPPQPAQQSSFNPFD